MEVIRQFQRPSDFPQLKYGQKAILTGSCFSSHISDKLRNAGFDVLSNPAGVVFHPEPIARFIRESVGNLQEERLFLRDDTWLSWDTSSELFAFEATDLRQKLSTTRAELHSGLQSQGLLMVTLGSAHGYTLKESGLLVANCHKMPGNWFEKNLTPLEELTAAWSETLHMLHAHYPLVEVVFTISPVKYLREGWQENHKSKARLTELIGRLQQDFQIHYLPVYELVNDALRDYRYFEEDGAHPNALAINAVWQLCKNWFFDSHTDTVVKEAEAIRSMESHKLLFPGSRQSELFLKQLHEKRESFLSLHPDIIW